jgi:hypothetical protein
MYATGKYLRKRNANRRAVLEALLPLRKVSLQFPVFKKAARWNPRDR